MSTATAQVLPKDITLPAAGRWTADVAHSSISFEARHLMVTKVRGVFRDYRVEFVMTDDPSEATVEAEIASASIDTGNEQRDGHLRSPDFLDVENQPAITFRGSGARYARGNTWQLPGELTILGVTRPVTLDLEYLGVVKGMQGEDRAGFSVSTEIDREDWGITWNVALETGGLLVSKRVKIELEIQATRVDA